MARSDFVIILCATVLAFTVLYAPQPLLPVLAHELDVTDAAASLLVTVTLLPLSVAPILYGYVLEAVPAKRVLVVAMTLLAATVLALAAGPGYFGFMALRLLQGLLLPAVLTSLMTYVATTAAVAEVARAMAVYVACTVFGGFAGRAFAGLMADVAGWQASFLAIAVLLLLVVAALTRLRRDEPSRFGRVPPRLVLELLRVPALARAYLMIFCAFFVFAALLNFLPFRLTELSGALSSSGIALMYTGYLMGIVASLSAGAVARRLGGEVQVVLLGLAILLGATLWFLVAGPLGLFWAMFVLCAGMFLVHGTLPGYVNRLAPQRRGVVNGVYVAAYYAGGSAGSFAPGLLLSAAGWPTFVLGLGVVLAVALAAGGLALRAERQPS